MKKPQKPNQELKTVQSEIARINNAYAGQLNVMDDGFKQYVLRKVKDLKARELELMKGLGYV